METSTLTRRPVQARRRRNPPRPRRVAARRPSVFAVDPSETTALDPLRVAVIDDDSGFMLVLSKQLERLGWSQRSLEPTVSMETLIGLPIDALIVDPDVLGKRSWDWLERLFSAEPPFRVVVCAGPSTVAERVRALRMGVDDWLTKPCHPQELLARVDAVVGVGRRSEQHGPEPVTLGELEIRRDQYQAFVAGCSVQLTRREFEVIELLVSAGSSGLARDDIYEQLWGYPRDRDDRSIDVFVHKLRRKLAMASPGWHYIQTHYGYGYRIHVEPVALAA